MRVVVAMMHTKLDARRLQIVPAKEAKKFTSKLNQPEIMETGETPALPV